MSKKKKIIYREMAKIDEKQQEQKKSMHFDRFYVKK